MFDHWVAVGHVGNATNAQNNTNTTSETDSSENNIFHVFACFLTALTILGLCGNVLGSVVLNKLQKTTSGVRLLKYLAFADIATLLFVFEYEVLWFIRGQPRSMVLILDGLTSVFFPLLLTVYTLEINFTVLIACQRSFALAKPLLSSIYIRDSVINKLIVLVVCFSLVFCVPEWLIFKRDVYWDSEMNMAWITYTYSDFEKSSFYEIYYTYLTLVFRTIIPMTVLIVCNITIIVCVRRRMSSQSGRSGGDHLTTINIAIITMSVITHVTSSVDRFTEYNPYFTQVSSLLAILNCSANIVFYCTFGRSFRKTLVSMLQGVCGTCVHPRVVNEEPSAISPTTSFDTVL